MKELAPNLQDYSHIELNDEELAQAILRAKMEKAYDLDKEEQRTTRLARRQKLMQPMDYEYLKRFVTDKAKALPFKFRIDKNNENVFRLLCLYFSNTPEFENYGFMKGDEMIIKYSLNKGVLLYSKERGSGKTTLMNLFFQNSKNSFAVIATKRIASFYQTEGDVIIPRYSKPWECEPQAQYLYQKPVGICFDDLGDEEIKNHYGNKENVMQRVLQAIYDDGRKEDYRMFHATTNQTPDELEAIYGKRVRSRMREMFNLIELPGEDRRM